MTSPDGGFGIRGEATGMAILQAIWYAEETDRAADNVRSFSELQDIVGVTDSGRFNYHPKQLVGHFIDERANGYQLPEAGEYLVRALPAGTVTEEPSLTPRPIDPSGPHYGGTVAVYYEDEQLFVRCPQGTHSEPSQKPGPNFNTPIPAA